MLRNFGQICVRACGLSTCSISRGRYIPRDKYTPKHDAGIHRRLKLIAEDEADVYEKNDIDQQSMLELEEDLTLAADLNDEVISEMKKIAWAKRLKMAERKYFRPPKEPQMLTWTEKQQIINLNRQDPQKWCPEVLAESFPASPSIIRKILKANWKPLTKERLKEHDRKVSDNWIAFHKGELTVHDPKLKVHLEKFKDRKDGVSIISDEEAAKAADLTLPKPKKTEFSSLVTIFKPKAETEVTEIENKRLEENIQPPKQIGNVNPTNIVDRSGAYYTLDQYRSRLSNLLDTKLEDREVIKAIVSSGNKDKPVENSAFESYIAPSERFKPNAVVRQKGAKSRLKLQDPDNIPGKITIPKEQWKPGLVYKVKDCFYNDKGYFLYRVPGLNVD